MLRQAVKAIPGAVWLKRKLLGYGVSGCAEVPVRRAAERGQPPRKKSLPPPADFPAKPRCVLYRIIGNDLVPRHRKGQARANLPFILQHEPDWPGCEKWFVVNRIADPEEEAAIIEMLETAGCRYLHIPFILDEYAAQSWDIAGVPPEFLPTGPNFQRLRPDQQARVIARLNRFKIDYFTHNNGARNAALAHGRQRGDWILPWDGNCFLTDDAWRTIQASLRNQPDIPYWLVPMARITDNQRLLVPDFRPIAEEEPQVIFRRDASQSFDENFIYGRRPKVELFWRLGVPGSWDEWGIEPWDPQCPEFASDAGAWSETGWVARLSSGRSDLEKSEHRTRSPSASNRALIRAQASMGLVDQLDRIAIARRLDCGQPVLLTAGGGSNARIVVKEALHIAQAVQEVSTRTGALEMVRSAMQGSFALALASQYTEKTSGTHSSAAKEFREQASQVLAGCLARLPGPHPNPKWFFGFARPRAVFFPELIFALDSLRYLAARDTTSAEADTRLCAWLDQRHQSQAYLPGQSDSDTIAFFLMEQAAAQHRRNDLIGLRDTLRDAQAWAHIAGEGEPHSQAQQAAAELLDLIGAQAFGVNCWPELASRINAGHGPPPQAEAGSSVTARTLQILQNRRLRLRGG